MIISVASGKGGTGKTTIATNLACSIGDGVQLLDCDVEEPNVHLFLTPEITSTKTVYSMVPEIDNARCTGCGQCAQICRFSALTVVGETVLAFPELCHGCGGCVEVCPENAATESQREIGVVETGKSDALQVVQGRIRIGEPAAPPLIRSVREYTSPGGETIIDAPPGTSCPVVASMRGGDFILLVTEPTPFGLHDLQLAVGVVEELRIPCGLVINRADCGDDGVHVFAREKGIPVLMEIPFSREIAAAYSNGKMLIEMDYQWKGKFHGLYEKIQAIAAC